MGQISSRAQEPARGIPQPQKDTYRLQHLKNTGGTFDQLIHLVANVLAIPLARVYDVLSDPLQVSGSMRLSMNFREPSSERLGCPVAEMIHLRTQESC